VKRSIRRLISPFWRMMVPLRRALMRRVDARIVGLVARTVEARMVPPLLEALAASEARLERIEGLIVRAECSASTMAEEVDLVLGGLTRELFRLKAQVQQLRGDDRRPIGGLSLLAESEDDGLEPSPAGRARVG
jgi:hypothetical protein